MSDLELHPLCSLFPPIEGIEFEALKADIEANGLQRPIVVLDGMILDGANRYRACLEAGVEPVTVSYAGSDPLQFVLSENLHRRHLTPGQHAAIVAAATDWIEAEAHGGDRKSSKCNVAPRSTSADRAAQSGASVRTQKMADKVARRDPELVKRVAHGEISLPQAARQVEQGHRSAGRQSGFSRFDNTEQSLSGDCGPTPEEMAVHREQERLDRAKYDALVEVAYADDKLAAALTLIDEQAAEIKRQAAEIAVLRERQTGLMNEKVQLEAQAKRWRRIAEKHGYSDRAAR
ncbi:ParB N-terminal domain-containing protein [Paraburkholderia kururiensis]|uniref:ParB N-terminal domain-containing protein n=1 Tax=Paraburkholderia kururiensis TaxID=984307 RepID=A0ABZ0WSA4_9BURK|nr:ParB N-terminal domain-containing protein [Paraburkholderia kururiensis]WQD80270.1 ParB N-terminal domain-containing protein [Paraburkholderia kururiensis]